MPVLIRLGRRCLLAVTLAALGFASFAVPASATEVNDGTGRGLTVRPPLITGWTMGLHEVLGGRSNNPPVGYEPGGSFGRINWVKWRRNYAIGRGILWQNSCSPSCGGGRWSKWGKVKVRLYKRRYGHFNRMKFTRIGGPKNTAIFAYRSSNPPQWRIIRRFR